MLTGENGVSPSNAPLPPSVAITGSKAPPSQGTPLVETAPLGTLSRSPLAVPEFVKLIIEKADEFIPRIALPPPQAAHLQSILKAALGTDGKTDLAELALLSALIRASPEVKRLTDWASTLRTQTGVVPLHAATFALLGAIYFFARLVKYDAALASRVLDGYPETGKPSSATESGFRLTLKDMAQEKESLLGVLVSRERSDTNSATQMHLLAGILSPLFAEISKAERAQKPSALGALFARFSKDETPTHLRDLGLLETIRPAHVDVIVELENLRKKVEAKEQTEAAAQREREAQLAAERDTQKKDAEAKEELTRTRGERHKKILQSLTRILGSAKTTYLREGQTTQPVIEKETALTTIFELITTSPETNDHILYAILSDCPSGAKALLPNAEKSLNSNINAYNKIHSRETWEQSKSENVALGILWETLSRIVIIHEPKKFEMLLPLLLAFVDKNNHCVGPATYKPAYLHDVRNAFMRMHEKKCGELLP
jgi:hypothetical protein